jgi:hypothetical protein
MNSLSQSSATGLRQGLPSFTEKLPEFPANGFLRINQAENKNALDTDPPVQRMLL